MYCTNCGKNQNEVSKFCTNCGVELDAKSEFKKTKAEKKKYTLVYVGILFGILFAALYAANVDTTKIGESRSTNFISSWLFASVIAVIALVIPLLIIQKTVLNKKSKKRKIFSVFLVMIVLLIGFITTVSVADSHSWNAANSVDKVDFDSYSERDKCIYSLRHQAEYVSEGDAKKRCQ